MDDERVLVAQLRERSGNEVEQVRVRDAHDLPPHPGRVGQRAEQVHDREQAQLAAHRARVTHGRVVVGCEEEDDADLFEDSGLFGRFEVETDPECLQNIRASAARPEAAVPVLGDAGAEAGGEQRRGGRDVEGGEGPATGAAGIDEVEVCRGGERDHRASQGPHAPGDLRRRGSAGGDAHEERGELNRGGTALHHLVERCLGIRTAQRAGDGGTHQIIQSHCDRGTSGRRAVEGGFVRWKLWLERGLCQSVEAHWLLDIRASRPSFSTP